MTVAFLGTLSIFFGYTLVYAAVAKAGRFATDPWAGLFSDAYTDTIDSSTTPSNAPPVGSNVNVNLPSLSPNPPVRLRTTALNYSTPGHQGA